MKIIKKFAEKAFQSKKNKRLWVMICTFGVVVIIWWGWKISKPSTSQNVSLSLHRILMEHIEYLPDVYRAHDKHFVRLYNDSNKAFIFRYSPGGCSPCYFEDLNELRDFQKSIGKDIALL